MRHSPGELIIPQFPLPEFMLLLSACYHHRMPVSTFFSCILFGLFLIWSFAASSLYLYAYKE